MTGSASNLGTLPFVVALVLQEMAATTRITTLLAHPIVSSNMVPEC